MIKACWEQVQHLAKHPWSGLQVQEAVQLILDTQPKGGAVAGGMSREEVVDGLCEDLLSKMPALFDGEWLQGAGCWAFWPVSLCLTCVQEWIACLTRQGEHGVAAITAVAAITCKGF